MALQEGAAQRLPVSEFMNLVSGHSVELLGWEFGSTARSLLTQGSKTQDKPTHTQTQIYKPPPPPTHPQARTPPVESAPSNPAFEQ
jgi:hypothetical protein